MFKRENLKHQTIAAHKAIEDGDLDRAIALRKGEVGIGSVKAQAMGDHQRSIETMEELIKLDYKDRGIDFGRRDDNSELCDSVRSSCDYWEDIDKNMNDDIKSRFKQLAQRRKQLLNATENENQKGHSGGNKDSDIPHKKKGAVEMVP